MISNCGVANSSLHGVAGTQWSGICEFLTRNYAGSPAKVELMSATAGRETIVERDYLLGIAHDALHDLVELTFGDTDHHIHAPREIFVEELLYGRVLLQIVEGDGSVQLVTLEPNALACD
jgi:hypothetical protein